MEALLHAINGNIPYLEGLPEWAVPAILSVVYTAFAIGFIAVFALFTIWLERKVSAHMQDRLGPMEVGGFHGWLQTIADAVKLLLKEDIIPRDVDRLLFLLAPIIVFVSALAVYVALPFAETFIGADLNIGLFYILAVSSLVVIGIIMAGWASNNKWSLYGTMRSAAQVVSYEIPVALALLVGIMAVGSLSMQDIVEYQAGGIHRWLVFRTFPFNLVAFFLYYTASLAEVNRHPFDLPEAESELVAGYHTEYSGFRFALFFLSEYANMFAVAAIATTVFLGGWQAPFGFLGVIPGFVWFLLKSMSLVFVQLWLRWTLPRFRVDQMMTLCWKVLVPASFINILAAGIMLLVSY